MTSSISRARPDLLDGQAQCRSDRGVRWYRLARVDERAAFVPDEPVGTGLLWRHRGRSLQPAVKIVEHDLVSGIEAELRYRPEMADDGVQAAFCPRSSPTTPSSRHDPGEVADHHAGVSAPTACQVMMLVADAVAIETTTRQVAHAGLEVGTRDLDGSEAVQSGWRPRRVPADLAPRQGRVAPIAYIDERTAVRRPRGLIEADEFAQVRIAHQRTEGGRTRFKARTPPTVHFGGIKVVGGREVRGGGGSGEGARREGIGFIARRGA